MNGPLVRIRFDGNGRVYRPGETLSGEYRIEAVTPEEIKAVEVSVLWYTEGKGDEDLAVHAFWRIAADNGDMLDLPRPGRFSTVLPRSPLSYRGVLVRVRWCVRVRVFLARGRAQRGGRDLPARSECDSRCASNRPACTRKEVAAGGAAHAAVSKRE